MALPYVPFSSLHVGDEYVILRAGGTVARFTKIAPVPRERHPRSPFVCVSLTGPDKGQLYYTEDSSPVCLLEK